MMGTPDKSWEYKGWTIYRNFMGWYVASNIVDGHLVELRADTRKGIRQIITDHENGSK